MGACVRAGARLLDLKICVVLTPPPPPHTGIMQPGTHQVLELKANAAIKSQLPELHLPPHHHHHHHHRYHTPPRAHAHTPHFGRCWS